MEIKINPRDLVFKTSTMTDFEKALFFEHEFSEFLDMNHEAYSSTVSGTFADLYKLLHKFSLQCDIELL
jgi:hypothetical protein